MVLTNEEQSTAINKLIQMIRFPTVSDSGAINGSYDACSAWLQAQLQGIGLEAILLPESAPHKPIVIGTWKGTQPELPCIILNSHYDVVPVDPSRWSVEAFAGIHRDNTIYGRGAQDMKCVCVQYLTALGHLLASGFTPRRTIHVTYVPDEEIGGQDGMNILLHSAWFQGLQVALALDEGLANPGEHYSVFYGERLPWWIHITCQGPTGHGSRFVDGTAVSQVIGVCNKALAFRQQQQELLHGAHPAGCSHAVARSKTLGDVTSLNVTMLRAGVQANGKDVINVIPSTAEAALDIRVSPHVQPSEIKETLDLWCQEINTATPGLTDGQGVRWEFYHEPLHHHALTVTDDSNPWWTLFQSTLQGLGVQVIPEVFPAATDSRFLRSLGINALGFSPIRRSPILLHEHDECIKEEVYLEGCEVYVQLIKALATQGEL